MGWSVPLLCAAATSNFLIQSVDGYCREKKPNDVDFCKKWDNEEKNCQLENLGGEKCDWVDGARPNLNLDVDPRMMEMNKNALENFDAFKSHISTDAFIKDLTSDHMMSLPIDVEMQYTTSVTLQLLRAFYYEYFEYHGKTEALLAIDWYILAVGSFGRNELLPCSDLDILVLGIGPGLLTQKEYEKLSKANKEDDKLKGSKDADIFLRKMNQRVSLQLKQAAGDTFTSKAFELDKAVPRKFADSTEKILDAFMDVDPRLVWFHGGSMSPISFFADVQVIYERHHNTKTSFLTLQHNWIQKVPLSTLNVMFKADLNKNLDEIKADRKLLFPKTKSMINVHVGITQKGKEEKKEAEALSKTEVKPKYYFIRAYSLLTYWSYLLAYKYPKWPQSHGPFLMGTVARLNKLAEWGYIQPEVAFWSSYYFHQACIWSLRGNLITVKQKKMPTKVSYAHGKGFVFGKNEKFVKLMLGEGSEAIVKLTDFGKAFRGIYDDSKKLEQELAKKNAKRNSLSLPSDIVAKTIKVDEQTIQSNLVSQSSFIHSQKPDPYHRNPQMARRQYDDNYYEDYYFQDFKDEEQYKPSNQQQQQQQTAPILYFSITLNMILLSSVFFAIAFISGFVLTYFCQKAQIFKYTQN